MKSKLSDYLEVVEAIYRDASAKCSADVSALRDLETIKSRVENEGLSFLTITLPQFSKDFERALELGGIGSTCFYGFKRVKHGSIPAFLQGMTSRIFDRKTGKVISYEPPTRNTRAEGLATGDISTIVESVRQICRTFSKVEFACTPEREQAAADSFYEIEHDFKSFSVPSEFQAKFLAVSRLLWDNMVRDFNPSHVTPKHGPGATAEQISGNQKYVWQRWHHRLEPYFPLVDMAYPLGVPLDSKELEIVTMVSEDQEQPVKVVFVPKTLKSPRVIAIEPVCMQYAQQGIRDYLYDKLESFWLTKRHVNFRDQTINQRLAMYSSNSGRLATIDLSEASDRVPLDLAMRMFDGNPDLRDSIMSCRSSKAQLPDGRLIDPLRKFASMGSALCFPVEAMYFYTICVVALLDCSNLSYTQRNCFKVSRRVYVYGDDIIVPSTNADVVLDYLQKYNCKVNVNKTFYRGSFRESCGVDAYSGYEVTPTYIRKPCPENKRDHASIISWCATANLFYLKGYWQTASLIFRRLEKIIGPLPYVRETSSVIGRYSFLGFESVGRWQVSAKHPKMYSRYSCGCIDWTSSQSDEVSKQSFQRFEVNGWKPSPVYRSDELDGWAALMKCMIKMERGSKKLDADIQHGHSPSVTTDKHETKRSGSTADLLKAFSAKASLEDVLSVDRQHLDRSALHGAVTLKRRWATTH
jgi:hypothetical protein